MNRKNADRSKQKKKRSAKDIVLDILLVVFLLIAVGSGAYLGRYYYIAKNAQNNFNDLKGMLDTDGDDTEKVTVEVSDKSKDNGEKKILKKFEKLYEKNSDIAGWLTIDGTTIDYPVMYTPDDNDYYLHLDFDKNWSDPGTPFIDTNCRPFDDRTDNVLIYGHNMKSGIMFRELLQYEDESFYKKHKNIKFDTLYETGTYEVIGAFRSEIYPDDDTEHYHYYEFFNAADKAEFDEYIDFVKSNTSYDSGVTAEYGDELITLSTCASHTEDGRFVVVARRITGDDK